MTQTAPFSLVLIVGSVRQQRTADALLPWLTERLAALDWAEVSTLDLRPARLDESRLGSDGESPHEAQLAGADGFILLTPEYNHSLPGALKLALDSHSAPWRRKPFAIISYGARSGGIRATEHLRTIIPELNATSIRESLAISQPWQDFDESGRWQPGPDLDAGLSALLAELHWWVATLSAGRAAA